MDGNNDIIRKTVYSAPIRNQVRSNSVKRGPRPFQGAPNLLHLVRMLPTKPEEDIVPRYGSLIVGVKEVDIQRLTIDRVRVLLLSAVTDIYPVLGVASNSP